MGNSQIRNRQISDAIIKVAKLARTSAPLDGQILTYDQATDFVKPQSLSIAVPVINETPSGDVDGSNNIFTLANTPTTGSVLVYLNGQLQTLSDDYGVVGTTVIFQIPPPFLSKIRVSYFKDGTSFAGNAGSMVVWQSEEFVWVNGSNQLQTFTHNVGRKPDFIKVYVSSSGSWNLQPDYSYTPSAGNTNGYLMTWNSNDDFEVVFGYQSTGGGSQPTRLRAFWYTSTDVGSFSSSGGFVF